MTLCCIHSALAEKCQGIAQPSVGAIEKQLRGIEIAAFQKQHRDLHAASRIAERLSGDLRAILSRTDIREPLGRQGFEAQGSTPAEMDRHNREQLQTWQRVIRETKIPVE